MFPHPLCTAPAELLTAAREDHNSVIELAAQLVCVPSRGGIDPYDPVLDVVRTWLHERALSPTSRRDGCGAAAARTPKRERPSSATSPPAWPPSRKGSTDAWCSCSTWTNTPGVSAARNGTSKAPAPPSTSRVS